jgi:hypothetical protein
MKIRIIILIIGLVFTACDMKREAVGSADEIIVIVDQDHREIIADVLNSIFNDTLFTPKPEPVYKLSYVDPAGFNDLKRQTNLILGSIGSNATNSGTRLIRSLLGNQQFEETLTGSDQVIFTRDQFARDQLFMILSAENEENLRESLVGKTEWIKSVFNELFEKRQKRFLFGGDRRKRVERSLNNQYNWGMIVPWGWQIIKELPDSNFVWFGREYPFRWISVHWEDGIIIPDSETADSLIRAFPEDYYGHVNINDYQYALEPVEFNHWTAWQATGIWESIAEPKGGPFISYIFYDGVTNRTYFINLLVFLPGKNKSILLRQLDIIAHSFYVLD